MIDGNDLHPFHMAARNRTGGSTPYQAFWEYQGYVCLSPGLHWIRLQDVLPEIVALRLEPVTDLPRPQVPWQRYPVPAANVLAQSSDPWTAETLFGQPRDALVAIGANSDPAALQFSVNFTNTDRHELFGGDAVRMWLRGAWDLEPFGRLSFRFQGQSTGHVVSLTCVDLQGNEKLLWRYRDVQTDMQNIQVPISFEGNDVFDPGHVVAVCLELDEGNVRVDQVNTFGGSLIDPRVGASRRDRSAAKDMPRRWRRPARRSPPRHRRTHRSGPIAWSHLGSSPGPVRSCRRSIHGSRSRTPSR